MTTGGMLPPVEVFFFIGFYAFFSGSSLTDSIRPAARPATLWISLGMMILVA